MTGLFSVGKYSLVSDQPSDSINRQKQVENQCSEALFLNIHENEQNSLPVDDLARQLVANEKAVAETLRKFRHLAEQALGLQLSPEPQHFLTLRDCAAQASLSDEPAYEAFYKRLL